RGAGSARRLLEEGLQTGAGRRREAARQPGLGRVGLSAHVPEEIDPVDQLHREEPLLLVRRQLVEGDEVRVGNIGQRAKLLLELYEGLRGDVAQDLEGDGDVPLPVDRRIHDTVATSAETPLDDEAV